MEFWPQTFPIWFRKRIPGSFGSQPAAKQSISEKIAAYNPFLWWKLNETSGVTIIDYGSGAHNANYTAGGGALNQPGIGDGNGSILFDGTGTQVSLGPTTLTMPAAYTIGVAMKLGSAIWTEGVSRTIRFDRTDTNNYARLLRGAGNNALVFQTDFGGAGDRNLTLNGLSTTNWFFFFGTADTTDTNAYAIDTTGAVLASSLGSGPIGAWSAGNAVYQMGYIGQYLSGYFAHMMILPSKLTQAQLQALAVV